MAENEIEAAQLFAQYAANLKYEDIPADVREGTKRSILDTLAVTVAGSSQNNQYKALVELIKDAGGKEESTMRMLNKTGRYDCDKICIVTGS